MKQFILLLFLTLPLFVFGQGEFAPVGSMWYYAAYDFSSEGYQKISSEKDTSVLGIPCRKLTVAQTLYDYFTHQYNSAVLPSKYVYDSSGVYYFFSHGHFSILYDFNKQPGEFWITDAYDFYDYCGPIGKVYVDSVGTDNIEGMDLEWMMVHNDSTWEPYLGYKKIYRRIGSGSYLFPVPACVIWEGAFSFRCYDDSTLHHSVSACEYIYNSVSEIENSGLFKIFPNPASRILFVQSLSPKKTVIGIYDLLGKKEITSVITPISGTAEIDISVLKNGIHFLKSGNQMQMFIKE